MRISHLLLLTAFSPLITATAMAESTVALAPFHAVGLTGGGDVVVHAGAVQSVRVLEGSENYTRFTVRDGSLKIENCPNGTRCPRDYRLHVEITVPVLTALAVSEGGSLRADGAFPAQRSVSAAVSEGGIVDIRAVPANDVSAAINEGGRVLVMASASLTAAVLEGGHITYWGNPHSVTKAIHDGGAITQGAPGDLRRPVSDLQAPPRPVRAVGPAPAVPPTPYDAEDTDNDSEDMNDNDDDNDRDDGDDN